MGLFLCDLCDKPLEWQTDEKMWLPHVCLRESIRLKINNLEERCRKAENRLIDIQESVFRILTEIGFPVDDNCSNLISNELLGRLWRAADCKWHNADTASDFHSEWMATHRVLCEAFDVFRSKKYGNRETLLEKLTRLKESCDVAKKVLGYENSELDMTPEQLVKNNEHPAS